ncbi:MAG: polyhydroxybutyrate depolymerase [Gemmataceae bacterium]|nr:polyhydroxybutyrate depolymerase [Gemmataceae bacterium]
MQFSLALVAILAISQSEPLGPGDHKRPLTVDELKRPYWVHVPPKYDPKQPSAVVLVLHGALMDGKLMEGFSGLSRTADEHNFIAVYPSGTMATWNAGLFPGEKNNKTDDVKYLGKVLDDVESAFKVDKKRIYITGLSNGAMMSYRLASEMSERIAAIAPVAGTLALDKYAPKRPVPVIHFHGTKDLLVPFNGPDRKKDAFALMKFKSVNDTIQACVKANGCNQKPTETEIEARADKLKVIRKDYGKGKHGAEVILYVVENGGHTWPGVTLLPAFLGASTKNISANEVMWEFFRRHPLK